MSVPVELSCASAGLGALVSSGTMRVASALPSSTPHWSKESICQIVALREHAVLVERDQRAQRLRRQPVGQDGVRGAVAFEGAVGHQPFRRPLGADLLRGLAKRQRLGLREDVGHQQIVMVAQRVQRAGRSR